MAFKGPFQPQIFYETGTASVQNVASAELLHKPNQNHQVPGCFWGAKIQFPPPDRILAPFYAVVPSVYKVASKCSTAQSSSNLITIVVLNCWKDFVASSVWSSGHLEFYSFRFIFWRQGCTIKQNCLFIPHMYRSLYIQQELDVNFIKFLLYV